MRIIKSTSVTEPVIRAVISRSFSSMSYRIMMHFFPALGGAPAWMAGGSCNDLVAGTLLIKSFSFPRCWAGWCALRLSSPGPSCAPFFVGGHPCLLRWEARSTTASCNLQPEEFFLACGMAGLFAQKISLRCEWLLATLPGVSFHKLFAGISTLFRCFTSHSRKAALNNILSFVTEGLLAFFWAVARGMHYRGDGSWLLFKNGFHSDAIHGFRSEHQEGSSGISCFSFSRRNRRRISRASASGLVELVKSRKLNRRMHVWIVHDWIG